MSSRPDWMLALWGAGVTWEKISTVLLWSMAAFKIGALLMALVVVWVSFWARRLSLL